MLVRVNVRQAQPPPSVLEQRNLRRRFSLNLASSGRIALPAAL
jgi:hypothetical protein